MELTHEQWIQLKKDLRRRFSLVGWVLLLYYSIMNTAVYLTVFIDVIVKMIGALSARNLDNLMDLVMEATGNAWGYFLAAGVGFAFLLLWKKPRYVKEEIFAKGKPMTAGRFFQILAIFLAGQTVYQIVAIVLEMILNSMGLSIMEGMAEMAVDTDNFSMFLYVGVLAPIIEEILFRGLIQRQLMPYGKRFAIFCSAFTFGIYHGNLLQSGFAFLVGLVLGYVASEYSIAWAMLLHMINNLVLSDMFTRLTSGLPEEAAALILWAILLAAMVASFVILIVQRRQIRQYKQLDPINKTSLGCFFSCGGIITLMVMMGLNMILSLVMMIRPI